MGCAVRAKRTLTFIAMKPGLATFEGPDYCGDISIESLSLNVEGMRASRGHLLDDFELENQFFGGVAHWGWFGQRED